MNEELERLRAAHADVAEPDPLLLSRVRERVVSALDEQPAPQAPPRLERRAPAGRAARGRAGPPRRRLALAGSLAVALAAVTAVSLDVAPHRIDAVAAARAALLPAGAIAHYSVTLTQRPAEGPADPRFADCNAGPLQVWRATDPTRWRAVQPVSANPSCGTLDLSQGMGPVTAPRFEVAYAGGRTSMYVPGRSIMLVIDDSGAPADGERRAPSTAAAAASIQSFATPPQRKPGRTGGEELVLNRPPDLISDIEQLLARGELRDGGETKRDGRTVRVLAGGYKRGDVRTRIEYVVDAETFAPISATSTSTRHGTGASAATTATFGGYERIALDGGSAKLLAIDAAPGTDVVRRTIGQIKNPRGG